MSEGSIEICDSNKQLNSIMTHLCSLLEAEGFKALPMPKSKRDNGAFISLNLIAANLADLARFEENLLVTPEVGSGVNWGTVLTDAPLEV